MPAANGWQTCASERYSSIVPAFLCAEISNALNWLVMVGTVPMAAAAHLAIGSNLLSSGSTNPLAAFTQSNGSAVRVVHNPRISANTDNVYIFNTDTVGQMGPFILQDEVPVGIEEDDPGPRSKELYVIASAVRAAGYGLWQKAATCTLT